MNTKSFLTHAIAVLVGLAISLAIGYHFILDAAIERLSEETKAGYLLTIEESYRMRSIFLLVVETDDLRNDLELHVCKNASELGGAMAASEPDNQIIQERVVKERAKWKVELQRLNIKCPEFSD